MEMDEKQTELATILVHAVRHMNSLYPLSWMKKSKSCLILWRDDLLAAEALSVGAIWRSRRKMAVNLVENL